MKTAEYLDKCKEKLAISSTYALAKAFGIDERRLHQHYQGTGNSDFVYFKIAQVLEMDAAFVIADIKSETEKDEVKREFFKSFAGSLTKVAKITLLVLCLSTLGNAFNSLGGLFYRRRYFV